MSGGTTTLVLVVATVIVVTLLDAGKVLVTVCLDFDAVAVMILVRVTVARQTTLCG
jgi:hypothetical protein